MSSPGNDDQYPPEYGFDGMGAATNIHSMSTLNNSGAGAKGEADANAQSSGAETQSSWISSSPASTLGLDHLPSKNYQRLEVVYHDLNGFFEKWSAPYRIREHFRHEVDMNKARVLMRPRKRLKKETRKLLNAKAAVKSGYEVRALCIISFDLCYYSCAECLERMGKPKTNGFKNKYKIRYVLSTVLRPMLAFPPMPGSLS
jgi:hypothetical protein